MNPHRPLAATLALTLFWTLACGNGKPREAGPHADEFGDVLFWDATDIDAALVECPADAGLEPLLDEQPFQVGAVLAYRLSDSGTLATLLDCTTYDDDDCTPIPGPPFKVNGHEMTAVLNVQEADVQGDCTLILTETMHFIDGGEEGQLTQVVSQDFVGDDADCDDMQAIFEDDQGVGLATCEITFSAELVFALHDRL